MLTQTDSAILDELFTVSGAAAPSVAELYHENTKLFPSLPAGAASAPTLQYAVQTRLVAQEEFIARHSKRYGTATTVRLPRPRALGSIPLGPTLAGRHSSLAFEAKKRFSNGAIHAAALRIRDQLASSRQAGSSPARADGRRAVPDGAVPARHAAGNSGSGCLVRHYHARTHSIELIALAGDAARPRRRWSNLRQPARPSSCLSAAACPGFSGSTGTAGTVISSWRQAISPKTSACARRRSAFVRAPSPGTTTTPCMILLSLDGICRIRCICVVHRCIAAEAAQEIKKLSSKELP